MLTVKQLRCRGSTPASQRVTKLLRSGLFHSVPEERLSKVKVASGDLEAPELGLSPANWEALRAEVRALLCFLVLRRLSAKWIENMCLVHVLTHCIDIPYVGVFMLPD